MNIKEITFGTELKVVTEDSPFVTLKGKKEAFLDFLKKQTYKQVGAIKCEPRQVVECDKQGNLSWKSQADRAWENISNEDAAELMAKHGLYVEP